MRAAGLLLLAIGTLCAQAQSVYRCERDGTVEYGEQACKSGREVPAADPRTPAQRAEAREVARREAALAREMRQERLAREAQRPAGAIGIGPAASAARPGTKKKKHAAHKPPAAASATLQP